MTDNSINEANLDRMNWTPDQVKESIQRQAAPYEAAVPGITQTLLSMGQHESAFEHFIGPAIKNQKSMHFGDKAAGPFQYMKATADDKGIDRFDLDQNVGQAAKDLATNFQRFGRMDLSVAAHFTGAGNKALQEGRLPDLTDGQQSVTKYVQTILRNAGEFQPGVPTGTGGKSGTLIPAGSTQANTLDALVSAGRVPTASASQVKNLFNTNSESLGKLSRIPQLSNSATPAATASGVDAAFSLLSGPGKRNTQLWSSIRGLFGA